MRAARWLLLALFASGCGPTAADRLYTPIACEEGTADCDGRLSTGCEARASRDDCCGEVCGPEQTCVGGRARCQ